MVAASDSMPQGMTEVTTELMTAEQLLGYEMPGKRVELVRGKIVVREPPGWHHGELTVRLSVALGTHLDREQAEHGWPLSRGRLAAGDPGFTLSRGPDTVRAPDVAYVSRERHPARMPNGYPELAPDLVVEIRSPSDRPGALLAKVGSWLDAGTQLVWIIDPARMSASVYRANGTQALHTEADVLDGEDVLPGFTIALRDLFTES